jgi:hypothetical protein
MKKKSTHLSGNGRRVPCGRYRGFLELLHPSPHAIGGNGHGNDVAVLV